MSEHIPPYSVEAEEAVLGSILVDADQANVVGSILEASYFYREKNLWVYEAMLSLVGKGGDIDQLTVANELSRTGKLEAIGGAAYLSHLIAETPSSVFARAYADIVRDNALRRKLMIEAERMKALAVSSETSAQAIMAAVSSLVDLGRSVVKESIWAPKDLAEWGMDYYHNLAKQESYAGLPTGFSKLDSRARMQPGESIIICGDTSLGKTTLLAQIARQVGKTYKVLFCSGEMTKVQVANREVAHHTQQSIKFITRGRYRVELENRIYSDGIGGLAQSGIYYLFGPLSPQKILFAARQMLVQYGLDLVMIDYLQILKDDRKGNSPYERAGNISRDIKNIATDLELPVVTASQLTRVDGYGSDRPSLSRLRDSGTIGEDADWVLGLYRERNEAGQLLTSAELHLLKLRQGGEIGPIFLTWDGPTQTYSQTVKGDD
uniref:DNA 5'-3' helicase n=1 Tax=viral metagenome TaxID=1070528 RepID=A0A6H1ZUC2_9ZZZZ